jgi:hypothetical protein
MSLTITYVQVGPCWYFLGNVKEPEISCEACEVPIRDDIARRLVIQWARGGMFGARSAAMASFGNTPVRNKVDFLIWLTRSISSPSLALLRVNRSHKIK